MKAPALKQLPCWNCNGTMVFYGHAGLYDFYQCPKCGVEQAAWKEDERIAGDRIATEKQGSPRPAFPGHKSRGNEGRPCSTISQGN